MDEHYANVKGARAKQQMKALIESSGAQSLLVFVDEKAV
jgi:hypothetical protein